jgi:hypothetical protein
VPTGTVGGEAVGAKEGLNVGAMMEGDMVGMAVGELDEGEGFTVLRLVRTTITQRRTTNELKGACMAQIADQIKSNERIIRCSLLDMR